MRTWFTRANGKTAHNQPGTPLYIPNEPPDYPKRAFNHTDELVDGGFARVGWPDAGDLRADGWKDRALQVYGSLIRPHHIRYLKQFVTIRVGDFIVIPARRKKYDAFVGEVIAPRRADSNRLSQPGASAYYYQYDIAAGDRYENAHRVDVEWQRMATGSPAVLHLPELGGLWLRAFGPVIHGHGRLLELAAQAGLLPKPAML